MIIVFVSMIVMSTVAWASRPCIGTGETPVIRMGKMPMLRVTRGGDPGAPTQVGMNGVLHKRVDRVVRGLEYPGTVAADFTGMVCAWKDVHGEPALYVLNQTLERARQARGEGALSKSQLAKIEEHVIVALGRIIKRKIDYRADCFDLGDVTEGGVANCFGYSQILYVLVSSVGLSVWPASVVPEHIANIVVLSDGTMVMVDLTRTAGFVSERIVAAGGSEGDGSHWRFENRGNLVRNNKTIHILDKNELIGEVYFCRGTVHYVAGRNEEAIADYKKAVELSPQSAKAYNNLGGAHLTLGEYAEAISNFNRAIELDPQYGSAYHNRANAYLGSGQYAKAIIDYSDTVRLDPNFAKAYLGRGYAYLAQGHYVQAVSDYTKAIELKPDYARAYYMRAISYAYLAEPDKARTGMRQALELDRTLKTDVEKMSDEFELDLRLN